MACWVMICWLEIKFWRLKYYLLTSWLVLLSDLTIFFVFPRFQHLSIWPKKLRFRSLLRRVLGIWKCDVVHQYYQFALFESYTFELTAHCELENIIVLLATKLVPVIWSNLISQITILARAWYFMWLSFHLLWCEYAGHITYTKIHVLFF